MMRPTWICLVFVGCNPYPKWPQLDSGWVLASEGAGEEPVDGEDGTPALDISPMAIFFDNVEVDRTRSEAVLLTSEGDVATILRDVELIGDSAFSLHDAPSGPVDMEPGTAEALRIDYSPVSMGSHEARLFIDSDGLSGSFMMGISGVGVAP